MSDIPLELTIWPRVVRPDDWKPKGWIAVDFDGTCVTHDFPEIGKDIGAAPVLRKLAEEYALILYTMRDGQKLDAAKQWWIVRNIPLDGVNRNPTQDRWTKSYKCYAHIYIDDAAFGCPLVMDAHKRPYVDWDEVADAFGIDIYENKNEQENEKEVSVSPDQS